MRIVLRQITKDQIQDAESLRIVSNHALNPRKQAERHPRQPALKRHKYESHASYKSVYKQIEKALKEIDGKNVSDQEKIRAILKRYAADEIGLDEAYYDLLEEELIPMPQRCGLSAKIPHTAEDEIRLKEEIRGKLL